MMRYLVNFFSYPLFLITVTCRVSKIKGKPVYLSLFTQKYLCLTRWIAALAIPIWLITLFAHTTVGLDSFYPATKLFNYDRDSVAKIFASGAIFLSIIGAVRILFFPRGSMTLEKVNKSVFLSVLIMLLGESFQWGISHAHQSHISSLTFSAFLIFAVAPLKIPQQIILAFLVLLFAPLAALITDAPTSILISMSAQITLPAGAMILGAVHMQWQFNNFKLNRLYDLRLIRKNREVHRQKIELEHSHSDLEKRNKELSHQRKYVVDLLASALTRPVAEKFEKDGFYPSSLENLVIIYIDAVSFSSITSKLLPERSVSEIKRFFMYFDIACQSYNVEPLRAEGDARLAVSGLSSDGDKLQTHQAVIGSILAMLEFRKMLPSPENETSVSKKVRKALWPARIGINIGPVVAGVIDTRNNLQNNRDYTTETAGRLWFDVYGETVNVAARLSQAAEPNGILVSDKILWEAGDLFDYSLIKSIQVKNTYIPEYAEIFGISKKYLDKDGNINEKFWDVYNDEHYTPVKPKIDGSLTHL